MRRRNSLTVIIALLATFGAAQADAEDRFFQIRVKQVSPPAEPPEDVPMTPGPNCYSFLDDGTWIDPLFPNPMGMWEALPDGVITQYTAWAVFEIPGVVTFLLVQNGMMTPNFSNGQLRLKAVSTVYLGDEEGPVLAEFVSTGHEVGACPPLP